jgi:hypothetical protein
MHSRFGNYLPSIDRFNPNLSGRPEYCKESKILQQCNQLHLFPCDLDITFFGFLVPEYLF